MDSHADTEMEDLFKVLCVLMQSGKKRKWLVETRTMAVEMDGAQIKKVFRALCVSVAKNKE